MMINAVSVKFVFETCWY